jgi:hypothetical protein
MSHSTADFHDGRAVLDPCSGGDHYESKINIIILLILDIEGVTTVVKKGFLKAESEQ